jgi:hypothetical protein
MATTELDSKTAEAAGLKFPPDTQLFMLNLLRYRDHADYGGSSEFTACSGQEAYFQRYLPAFAKIEGADKTSVVFAGGAIASLVAPADENWDAVAIVTYPSFDAFRSISENPQYAKEADPHRRAALADWRLIATTKLELPS